MGSLVQLCGIHQSFTIIPRFTFIMRSWYNLDRQDRTSKFTKTIWGFRSINVYSLGCFPPFFGVTWMNNSPLECPLAMPAKLVYFLCLIESFVPQLGQISRRGQVMFKIVKVQKMFFKVRTIGSNLLLR